MHFPDQHVNPVPEGQVPLGRGAAGRAHRKGLSAGSPTACTALPGIQKEFFRIYVSVISLYSFYYTLISLEIMLSYLKSELSQKNLITLEIFLIFMII